jgi:4-amino-4-deoxy-L-arabinose transferase-like glycosyltransferase
VTAVTAASPATTVPAIGRRAYRGREDDPAWVRPALLGLLVLTGVLYLWDLGASGWANAFYSAPVQASTHSWRALFFGSFDSSSFISVDKTPGSLWVMDLSARLFGVNSWSILVPQALEGVASVGLLYATVRRRFGAAAGLIAGGVLAVTPVATLMFRFNNPDALLVLALIGSAYAVTRALDGGSTRWLVLAGALVGVGFLAKMLQALLVVPGFGLVYLSCAPVPVRRRVGQLLAAGLALVVTAGWWVAAVALTPAADRPYVGGSTNNSILNLIFGYNGFGRLTGNETGSVGGAPGSVGRWGPTGLTRLFTLDMGSQISWLLPAALILGATVLWLIRRSPRTDVARAQILVWGSWLVVTGVTISLSKGIIHPYYTVALAPAIGALVGIGGVALWRSRPLLVSRLALAIVVAVTAIWAYRLMTRSADFHPWLRGVVAVLGVVVVVAVLVPPSLLVRVVRVPAVVAVAALVVGFTGPLAWSLDTASTPHAGAIPSAGPLAVASNAAAPGRGPGPGAGRGPGGFVPRGFAQRPPGTGGRNLFGRGGLLGLGRGGAGGGIGNLIDAGKPGPAVTAALRADASSYSWVAAAVGGENAAGYQLAASEPVMAIGGFNGTDPAPSLARVEQLVSQGRIHYFIGSDRGLFGGFVGGRSRTGPGNDASQIETWVESHFTARTIGGATLYDLAGR